MKKWTAEQYQFLLDHLNGTPVRDLAAMLTEHFGEEFSYGRVKSYLADHKLKTGAPRGCRVPHNSWPKEIGDYIRENYRGVGPKEMAQRVNGVFGTSYSSRQMGAWYKNHNLNSGLTGRFEKGSVPFTAGKRPQDVCRSPEALKRLQESWFKKGAPCRNKVPVGTEAIRQPDGYVWVKVAEPNKWRMRARVVWERHYGAIPKGYVITHKDNDRTNDELDNLMMISCAENRILNQQHLRFPDAQLTTTGVNIARTMVTIHRKEREIREKFAGRS